MTAWAAEWHAYLKWTLGSACQREAEQFLVKSELVFGVETAAAEEAVVVDVVVVDDVAGLTAFAPVAGGAWSTRRATESRRVP